MVCISKCLSNFFQELHHNFTKVRRRVSYPSVNLRLEFSQQVVQVLALVSNVMMCYRYLLLYYGMPCFFQWKSLLPIENTRGSLSQAEVPASGGLPAQVVPLLYLIQEGIAPPVLQASNQEAWRKSG